MNRRDFLTLSSAAALNLAAGSIPPLAKQAFGAAKADYTLHIAPLSLELGAQAVIRTVGYNGTVPGPMLRVREGKRVTIDVHNDSDLPELVHWHGQFVTSLTDGADEEGTPVIPPHTNRRYSFIARPAGTRWYHTHAMAHAHVDQGAYTGQYGFFVVEPKSEPGSYDQEIFLAARHWEPTIARHPAHWDVDYKYASLGPRMLGQGEPVRVREGQRVLFRLLNASATQAINLSLPGHSFKILSMDGNPVPNPTAVEVIQLTVGERVDALVEMNNPGIWVLGSIRDADRTIGLGVVVEYAGQQGEPRWMAPRNPAWDYTVFGNQVAANQQPAPAPEPDGRLDFAINMLPTTDVPFNWWTINGKSYPDTDPLLVKAGKRYRIAFRNSKDDSHPLHLHRHSFELVSVAGKPTAGIIKDVVQVRLGTTVEVDFIANNPGLSLLHCHNQEHMDFGFKTMVKYM